MAKSIANSGAAPAPSHEMIARRAHEIWENEGRPEGCAVEHWLRAVNEMKAAASPPIDVTSREVKPRTARRSNPRSTQTRF